MSTNQDQVRLTVDIPQKWHRELKARAVIQGKTLRELIMELIVQNLEGDHKPNLGFSPEEQKIWEKIQKRAVKVGQNESCKNLNDMTEEEKMQLALDA